MSLARLQSRAPDGLDAPPVSVEIHLSGGLPSFTIVGLPEAAVRESRERVRSALINSGFDFPARRITANLAPALVGGGPRVAPGEISIAHNGVLFLDELTEFSRHVVDQLREPLESGSITLARAERTVRYPSRFQWVSAMNPCACGYNGDRSGRCRCTSEQVRLYQSRLSGPLIDGVDLYVRLQLVDPIALQADKSSSQSSTEVKRPVHSVRERQLVRTARINACLTQKNWVVRLS